MADAVLLFVAAVLVMGTSLGLAVIIGHGRRERARLRRDAPRQLRADLKATDDYIGRINDALSEEDLDSLDRQRNEEP